MSRTLNAASSFQGRRPKSPRRRNRANRPATSGSVGGAPPAPPTEPEVAGRFARFRLRGLFGRLPWKDDAAFSVLDIYGQARAAPGAAAFAARSEERRVGGGRRSL